MLKGVSSIWQSYIENKSICLKNEKKMRSSYFEPGGGSLILNTTVITTQFNICNLNTPYKTFF